MSIEYELAPVKNAGLTFDANLSIVELILPRVVFNSFTREHNNKLSRTPTILSYIYLSFLIMFIILVYGNIKIRPCHFFFFFQCRNLIHVIRGSSRQYAGNLFQFILSIQICCKIQALTFSVQELDSLQVSQI